MLGPYGLLFAIDSGWLAHGGDDPGYEKMAFYTSALGNRCDVPPVSVVSAVEPVFVGKRVVDEFVL